MVPSTARLSPESAAYKLRTAWVEGYLTEPCMFHGILYAASANMDLLRGELENPVTSFHRAEAIRLTNQKISQLNDSEKVPPPVIAATWALAHVAVQFAQIHLLIRRRLTWSEAYWKCT
jgi:hypothetical protein